MAGGGHDHGGGHGGGGGGTIAIALSAVVALMLGKWFYDHFQYVPRTASSTDAATTITHGEPAADGGRVVRYTFNEVPLEIRIPYGMRACEGYNFQGVKIVQRKMRGTFTESFTAVSKTGDQEVAEVVFYPSSGRRCDN